MSWPIFELTDEILNQRKMAKILRYQICSLKWKKYERQGGDKMAWFNTILLLVLGLELALIYVRLGNPENKDTK